MMLARGGRARMGSAPLLCFNSRVMPKMKSHSGAKKRFKVTGTGKVRGRHGMTSHIRVKKNAKRQRRLDAPALIADVDRPRIKRMLGKS